MKGVDRYAVFLGFATKEVMQLNKILNMQNSAATINTGSSIKGKAQPVRNSKQNPKQQRNYGCNCGSGLKFKKCCGAK